MLKRIICFLVVILMLSSAVVPVSAADGKETADIKTMLEKAVAKSFESDYMKLNYRRYDSLFYKAGNDSVKATLVVYFHDAGSEGSDNAAQMQPNSLLSQLLSDKSDEEFTDYRYIVIAPQCPAGESWTNSVGAGYKFSPNATRVMSAVKELVDDISATDVIFHDRIVVMGSGNGATAAFDYFCRYTSSVSRVLGVGGFYDADAVATNERAKDKAFRIVAPKGDKEVYANNSNLNKRLGALTVPFNLEYHEYDGSTKDALKKALEFDEPSVTCWAVSENFSSDGFTVTCTAGKGGKISPPTAKVGYNGSTMINITQEKGFKIKSVKVNKSSVPLSALKETQNPNIFSYTISKIHSDTFVEVEFTTDTSDGVKYDVVIDRTISWCIWLSVGLLFAAAVIFGVFWYEKSLSYEKQSKQGK